MFKLTDLLYHENIVIQCHDNPDADAIASGFALYEFFREYGKKVRLVYSGRFPITKPNLLEMVMALKIPVDYVDDLNVDGLLITVDCQYGAGNVKRFPAQSVAIIDHHQQEIFDVKTVKIDAYLGSCATVVWKLLKDADFDLSSNMRVTTALYYGLLTDTNYFAEIYHPLDKDMRDGLNYDYNLIRKLKNSNLTMSDIEIAGKALLQSSHQLEQSFAIFRAEPCDPNILGFISDIALQVHTIDVCIIYNQLSDGIKYSVRSCIREVMANELAAYLAENIGSGGGHAEKAGGFISLAKFHNLYPGIDIDAYLSDRIGKYYDSYNIIYSNAHNIEISNMRKYKKRDIVVGYAHSVDVFATGTPLLIRTLEGDINTFSAEDIYIMVGVKGEVYPIKKEKFDKSYRMLGQKYDLEAEYAPTIRNRLTGEVVELTKFLKSCVATGDTAVYAAPLTKNTKVFTAWDDQKYMSGKVNDYLAIRQDDINDVYIIENSIFPRTYSPE
ncbi:MAG TPA: DHH family phosphoesterase [Methylomusa anaerophila]|uniref:Putative manganese-dependent inorganic pyrophosphatase n=1 Tax=Methylomusa anaerophila TaxID=1930071 RepID=A0A348AJ66_9FIRM|nr:DHH family phosphoesterase [Methylomusa anaerophila]BBB91114.1 putative manganese-dependent inorganic pyrophosphatase [Methylomusa anaerophila]HML88991.1 DHH family phosphoesterase [Methylomusa anaerophila]